MNDAPPKPVPGSAAPSAVFADCIVAVARTGDRAAFGVLFSHFAPRLKAFFLHLRGIDDATAEEMAQETMLLVWRKAALYDPTKAAASTWIFAVARNRRVDMLRRERTTTALENDLAAEILLGPASADPEALITSANNAARLREAMAVLPEDQGQVLRLSYFENKSHADISRGLGLPLGTVKGRLRLALSRLRAALGRDELP